MRAKEFTETKLPGRGTGLQSPVGSVSKKKPITAKDKVEELVKKTK